VDQRGQEPLVGDEPLKANAIAHADSFGLPLQFRPLRTVTHEQYLGARIFEEAGSLNQGAYALLRSESADEQDARPANA
jgi:hypothetical protein